MEMPSQAPEPGRTTTAIARFRTVALRHPIWTHPERIWGQPCFRDTRVPVDFPFEWLAAGDSVADFVENDPNVAPDRVAAVLREAAGLLVDRRKSA